MLYHKPYAATYSLPRMHYDDGTMGAMASQIISLTMVYSTVYSDTDQRNHQSSASLAFVQGIHRGPVHSTHKWPVTRKMFPFDDVIMVWPHMVKYVTFGMVKQSWYWLLVHQTKTPWLGLSPWTSFDHWNCNFEYLIFLLVNGGYMNVSWHGNLILNSGHVGDIFVIGCTRRCSFLRNRWRKCRQREDNYVGRLVLSCFLSISRFDDLAFSHNDSHFCWFLVNIMQHTNPIKRLFR